MGRAPGSGGLTEARQDEFPSIASVFQGVFLVRSPANRPPFRQKIILTSEYGNTGMRSVHICLNRASFPCHDSRPTDQKP